MKRVIIPLLLIAAIASIPAITWAAKEGKTKIDKISDTLVTRKYRSTDIDEISASRVKVVITQGNTTSYKLTAPDNIIDLIKVKVSGSSLEVGVKQDVSFKKENIDLKATLYITLPDLEEIDALVGAKIQFDSNFTTSSNLEILATTGAVVNASNLTVNGKADFSVTTGAALNFVNANFKRTEFTATTGGVINVKSGDLGKSEFVATTGAAINCKADIAAGSEASANTAGSINCDSSKLSSSTSNTGGSINNNR